MCCKKSCGCKKTFVSVIIAIALLLAIAVSVWHQKGLSYIVFVGRFFDIMIPVLGVGSLIKYLVWGGCHKTCDDQNKIETDTTCCKQ